VVHSQRICRCDNVGSVTTSQLATKIILSLRDHGHKAYLVGGCVRDHLLQTPPKDYDVATDACPDEILRHFPRGEKIGAHFGVILVCESPRLQVEVSTFRSDHAYSDGRRPDRVVFETDPKQDVLRRDFTINALLQDPISGEILDYVDGRADLANRIVRAIGEPAVRFREDHLRMLRAVRFAARLDFTIERSTLAAIRQLAPLIHHISAERIREELVRILIDPSASRGLRLLDETGLLAEILPEIKAMQGVEQPPEYHPEGDVWTHTLMMLDQLEHRTSTLAFGILLHDVGKPPTFRVAERIRFDGHAEVGTEMARQILERFRFSRHDTEQVAALVANHMRFKDAQQMRESTLKRFMRLPHFDEHLELHRIDCLCSNGNLDTWKFVQNSLSKLEETDLRPRRLLTGKDLIEAGYKPGPAFSRILESVETAQLDGKIHTKEEALQLVKTESDVH
jgi:poly(A) polymerase